ncbi:MAG: hypothetical protein ACTHKM_02860, partial [Tsuneonella sp.]
MAALLLPLALQASDPAPGGPPPPPQTELPAASQQSQPAPEQAGQPAPEQPAQPTIDAEPPPVDNGVIEGRRRPGYVQALPDQITQFNEGAVRAPPPEVFPTDQVPIPDRWRLVQTLGLVKERWFDPYNQNTYKGDRPLCIPSDTEDMERRRTAREEAAAKGEPAPYGSAECKTPRFLGLKSHDWFFTASAISDTV